MDLIVHSETSHIEKVNKLCRICCGRCLTAKQKAQGRKVYLCSDFKREILLIFNVQIDNDKHDTHSPNMCSSCVSKLRDKRCSLNNARVLANSTKDIWTAYDYCSKHFAMPDCNSGSTATGLKTNIAVMLMLNRKHKYLHNPIH